MRKLYFILPALMIAAGFLVFRQLGGVPVELAPVTRGPAVQAVYATGTVEATVMLPIASRVTARLMELKVDEGSEVAKDEVLAQLEDDDLRHSLQERQAQEEGARQDYQRLNKLKGTNAFARSQYDKAKAAWESAVAARKLAEAQIEFTHLTAPADGRIIRRDGEVGQLIPANQPVFWMSCCAPLRISAEVDEEDIASVQPGQQVLIRADAFPDETYEGKVTAITPKGDPVARSYRVRIEFTEPNPLMIGMTAETNIILSEEDNALLIPSSALRQGEVWQVENGKLKAKKVKTGARGAEQTQILEGLKEGDQVATNPSSEWRDGMRARIKSEAR